MQEWVATGMSVPMCTARPAWQTMSLSKPKYKNKLYNIHVDLIDILEVDTEKQVCHVTINVKNLI